MKEMKDIKNNDFLLILDMSNATKEQKCRWLCQMISNEVEKPEAEWDIDLICECADYLNEFSDPSDAPTPEQMQRILEEIKANHSDMEAKNKNDIAYVCQLMEKNNKL